MECWWLGGKARTRSLAVRFSAKALFRGEQATRVLNWGRANSTQTPDFHAVGGVESGGVQFNREMAGGDLEFLTLPLSVGGEERNGRGRGDWSLRGAQNSLYGF